jgi:potassium-transporting ATPase KdpC subunit
MRTAALTSVLMLVLLTALTGVVYPLVVTGVARMASPGRAGGSLLCRDGRVIGSELLGQEFSDPRCFFGRPSATVPACNAGSSGGSNLGPANPALADSLRARVARLRALDPGNTAPVPVDLVTASGSGLDPHVSPAAAYYQVPRVARLRGLSESAVRGLVRDHVEGRQFGVLGEPRVNVLRLNLALDDLPRGR